MSVFSNVDAVVKLTLLPHELGDIMATIQKKLNAMLFVYSTDLSAVPLLYTDIKFERNEKIGKIFGELPWIYMNISAKILTFNPSPGKIVEAKVKLVQRNLVFKVIVSYFYCV